MGAGLLREFGPYYAGPKPCHFCAGCVVSKFGPYYAGPRHLATFALGAVSMAGRPLLRGAASHRRLDPSSRGREPCRPSPMARARAIAGDQTILRWARGHRELGPYYAGTRPCRFWRARSSGRPRRWLRPFNARKWSWTSQPYGARLRATQYPLGERCEEVEMTIRETHRCVPRARLTAGGRVKGLARPTKRG